LKRALLVSDNDHVRIVTNESYKFHCKTQADETGANLHAEGLVLEPMARNTLAAILLGLENVPADADVLVLSSDHTIGDEELFAQAVRKAAENSHESIVTFGVQPSGPHTGYGYILPEQPGTYSRVLEFKEKPDLATAERYVAE
jgi:mannose-1-phosphate guanylyltransferase / mannose-6-phosphate isomerase